MSDEKNHITQDQSMWFPNFVELWKEFYFKTEQAWADAFREYVSTDSFVQILTQTLEGHLSFEKLFRENMDRFMAEQAIPSKKDIARVAELILAVEDKMDMQEMQNMELARRVSESLTVLIDAQNKLLETQVKQTKKIQTMEKELKMLRKQVAALPAEEKAAAKSSSKKSKATDSKKKTDSKKDVADAKDES